MIQHIHSRRGSLLAKVGTIAVILTTDSLRADVSFLGVASGDASSNEAIVWTRALDAAVPAGSLVNAQVSADSAFGTILATASGMPSAAKDYTIKFDIKDLAPGTQYYYRFLGPNGEKSSTGTFKTAPDPEAAGPVRFAFSGDCDGKMRPYPLTHDFNALNLDFFSYIGDTEYETASTGSPAVTSTDSATKAQLFSQFSRKYLEQFLPVALGGQNGLQTFFASQGNFTLMDNHELGNRRYINGGAPAEGPITTDPVNLPTGKGFAGTTADGVDVNTTGTFMNKSAGYQTLEQVYLNYQPVKEDRAGASGLINAPSDPRTHGTPQLFFAQQWGKNAIFINTDARSYRDIRLKKDDGSTDDTTASRANNPGRTMLGTTQLQWLKDTLLAAEQAGTPWKFVTVSDPIDQIGEIGNGSGFSTPTLTGVNADGGKSWMGGYRAERNDLLKFIADHHILNVVFLSTDDHQNRVNELLYSPTGDTETQSSYVKVPHCFEIVDGPLGATGPDTITDHTFANIQAIAADLALHQSNSHIDPIGLDANYPGLHDVTREGDPTADTSRHPIDFYSPDTFNYTLIEIGADCPTLTVTTYGINSLPFDVFHEASETGPARPILSFQIDGDIEAPVIQSVAATPNLLWPANHAMVPIQVSVAATDNYSIASTKIVSVSSNELVNGPGDGNTSSDWEITGDLTLNLRAERAGSGSGRTYTITVEVTDSCGNKSQQTATVVVPKSRKS